MTGANRDRVAGPASVAAANRSWIRPTVPQALHSHAFTSLGTGLLRKRAIEIYDELLAASAQEIDLVADGQRRCAMPARQPIPSWSCAFLDYHGGTWTSQPVPSPKGIRHHGLSLTWVPGTASALAVGEADNKHQHRRCHLPVPMSGPRRNARILRTGSRLSRPAGNFRSDHGPGQDHGGDKITERSCPRVRVQRVVATRQLLFTPFSDRDVAFGCGLAALRNHPEIE